MFWVIGKLPVLGVEFTRKALLNKILVEPMILRI